MTRSGRGPVSAAARSNPNAKNDLQVAAHARSEGLTLVSNNLREFNRVAGLLMENWIEAAP